LRILLLNEYFPPDTSATAKMAELVVETLSARHDVVVLCGRPSYDPSERHPWYLRRREARGKVTVERFGSTTYPRFRMRHRLANYLSYLALAIPRVLLLRADLVLAMTDPPVAGIAGAFVAMLKRRPFVYNIRDLYPDMALGGRIVRPSLFTAFWEKLHGWALRRADRVIVLGEDMRDLILCKGVAPARVAIVRDGAPVPASVPSADNPVSKEIRGGFSFVALHAGNLGFYGAWATLLGAARRLPAKDIAIVFVGEGANKVALQAAARDCPNVRFEPFRPAEDIPHVLAAGDVHIITVRRGLEGVVVPSKLYGVLAAGRPVLAVAPEQSDVARIVRRVGCGLVADPDDPTAVAAALLEFRRDPSRLAAMGARARAAAREYDRLAQLQLFLQTLEEVCPS
jgi:glycosyltransferase involved in cell wall biosynthesis